MIFNFFKQLANVTGLPPIVSICALVILLTLSLLGVFILLKVRKIQSVLSNLNNRLDSINQRLGWQSEESENIQPVRFKLGSNISNDNITNGSTNTEQIHHSAERRLNTEINEKIYELLKKSGQPTPYHDLTKHLSKEYPGYDYDFFLKEVEDLQKEGKLEVEIIAGKLYFQIRKT